MGMSKGLRKVIVGDFEVMVRVVGRFEGFGEIVKSFEGFEVLQVVLWRLKPKFNHNSLIDIESLISLSTRIQVNVAQMLEAPSKLNEVW
jgi:hypothetical protein